MGSAATTSPSGCHNDTGRTRTLCEALSCERPEASKSGSITLPV